MKEKKYIIKYRLSGENWKYVRKAYLKKGVTYWGNTYFRKPMLTDKTHLISASCMFNSEQDAKDYVNQIIAFSKKNTRKLISDSYSRSMIHTADIKRYDIEEYVPEFCCDTNKKSIKDVWMKDGSENMFCTSCGTNLYHGHYVLIRKAKICPFCLKRMGNYASGIIDDLKKTYPEIEDDYNSTMFVAHMD